MPEGVANVAAEEKIIDLLTLTAEPGVIGSMPAGGLNFGAAVNPQAIIDQPYQFDFYDGGGLDHRRAGSGAGRQPRQPERQQVRPTAGGGGRHHQHRQNARTVVFVGTFTTGQLEVRLPGWATRHRARGRRAQVRARRGAPHLQRRRGGARPARAVRDQARRVPPEVQPKAARWCAGAVRDRAQHRSAARRADLHGVPAAHRRSEDHGRAPVRPNRSACARSCWSARWPSAASWAAQRAYCTSISPACRSTRRPPSPPSTRRCALLQPFGRVDAVVVYDHFGIVPELVDTYTLDMVHRLAAG